MARYESVLDLIGDTPMVDISQLSPNPRVAILAKLEGQNPGGSVKDRAAKAMIEEAEKEGLLTPGCTMIEATLERFGEAQARYEELGGYALDAKAREILAGIGFSQERMDADVGTLSGGWKMRVALARILLAPVGLWLLDEPYANLDLDGIKLVNRLLELHARRGGAALITSHGAYAFTAGTPRRIPLRAAAVAVEP